MKNRMTVLVSAVLLIVMCPLVAQEETYAARRAALMSSLDGGVAILTSDAPAGRFNKSFYYLTGIKEPDAALVLIPGGEVEQLVFNSSGEWSYASQDPTAQVFRLEALPQTLARYTRDSESANVSFGSLEALSGMSRVLSRFSTLHNIDESIAELRIIKDSHEIETLRRACQITAEGLNKGIPFEQAGNRCLNLLKRCTPTSKDQVSQIEPARFSVQIRAILCTQIRLARMKRLANTRWCERCPAQER